MSVFKRMFSAIVLGSSLTFATISNAATISGGSDILSDADANQLESWLGAGSISMTNIFTRQAGSNGRQFHNAVDDMGATFTVISLDNGNVIGGYNPISWTSSGVYHDSGDFSAFLFNLTSGIKLDHVNGPYQTYHRGSYGPTFGGGHDLHIEGNLTYGYANIGFTYEAPPGTAYGTSAARDAFAGSYLSWTVTGLEVFSISEDVAPVPIPAGFPLLLGALGIMGALRAKQRKAT